MRVFLMAVGLLIASAAPTIAQEMPSWAAPQERPADSERFGCGSANPNCTDVVPFAPDDGSFECPDANPNCIDIDPAPVDGGLALLALLGAGYAARRLRRTSDEG